MNKSILLASLVAVVALSACGKKEEVVVAPVATAASEVAAAASDAASAVATAATDAASAVADAAASAASK